MRRCTNSVPREAQLHTRAELAALAVLVWLRRSAWSPGLLEWSGGWADGALDATVAGTAQQQLQRPQSSDIPPSFQRGQEQDPSDETDETRAVLSPPPPLLPVFPVEQPFAHETRSAIPPPPPSCGGNRPYTLNFDRVLFPPWPMLNFCKHNEFPHELMRMYALHVHKNVLIYA